MDQATEHGPLYWFLHNFTGSLRGFVRQRRKGLTIGGLAIFAVLFLLRGFIHPYLIEARQRSFLFVPFLALWVFWLWAREKTGLKKAVLYLVCFLGLAATFMWGNEAHDYIALYNRYRTLRIVELSKLPVTGHERLQPLNSIYSLAHEKAATEMESPQKPDFVRIKGEYRWTMAVEPAHFIPRFGNVKELLSVSDQEPDFGRREKVLFEVGESMLLSHNSITATAKAMSPWRFFNYEPVEIRYVLNDDGQWVQVVSLIRWTGIFFPRPEFGGVQVIRQEPNPGIVDAVKLMLFGAGEWIPPEKIADHAYLTGQNILPYEVSRYMAESFRFENGFLGPMPGNHQGDVRIPNLPADVNDQPFTTYFEEVDKDRKGMLYHYFALEPYDPDKQGLTVSLWMPADGTGPVYVYKHYLKAEALTGVSAIAAKVMGTRKEYDWTRNRPVEHRPFIRDVDGVRRFFWMTTIVTFKEGTTNQKVVEGQTPQWFIAGTTPSVVLTEASVNVPVWVGNDPDKWIAEVRTELDKLGGKKKE